jgi:hypothetical protein
MCMPRRYGAAPNRPGWLYAQFSVVRVAQPPVPVAVMTAPTMDRAMRIPQKITAM